MMTVTQESERIAALHRLRILDTPPSRNLDQVTRLAAAALGVPIVLVSLVDEKRQWFKSRVGLDSTETPRAISFCAHAVVDRSPLVVKDAALDIRFANNPMVTGPPYVRAYAGIPLYTLDGHAIGALCAIDRKPRNFTTVDMSTLRDAARAIEDFMHAEESAVEADSVGSTAEPHAAYRAAFMQSSIGLCHVTPAGRLLRANSRFHAMLGAQAVDDQPLNLQAIIHPEQLARAMMCMDHLLVGGRDACRLGARLLREDGSSFWTDLSFTVIREESGRPEYLVVAVEDVSPGGEAELAFQTSALLDSAHALREYVRRRAEFEETSRAIENRFRASSEYAPVLVSCWNESLRCQFVNDAHAYWLDRPIEAALGASMQESLGSAYQQIEVDARLALQGREQHAGGGVTVENACSFTDVICLPDRNVAAGRRGVYLVLLSPHAKTSPRAGTGAAPEAASPERA